MALRSYDAHNLVNLPSMTAPEVAALGSSLLAEAQRAPDPVGMPELVKSAVTKLEGAVGALLGGMKGKLPTVVESPALTIGAADRDEDAAWGGLYRFLAPFSELPDSFAEKAVATGLLATIFPTGLRFTRLSSRAEWTEAESRRARMTKEGLDAKIEALGGAVFVTRLKNAHANYGVALGITEAQVADPKEPLLGDLRREALAAIRSYVVKVSAHADSDDPAIQALTERLLRPLTEWQPRRSAASPAPAESEVPEADPIA